MDKTQGQSIDERARRLIEEAVGKVAIDKKIRIAGGAGSTACEGERSTLTRGDENLRDKPGSGQAGHSDAIDHDDIEIYGAYPKDD